MDVGEQTRFVGILRDRRGAQSKGRPARLTRRELVKEGRANQNLRVRAWLKLNSVSGPLCLSVPSIKSVRESGGGCEAGQYFFETFARDLGSGLSRQLACGVHLDDGR